MLLFLVLSGCSNRSDIPSTDKTMKNEISELIDIKNNLKDYTSKDILTCIEGDYLVPSDMQKQYGIRGFETKSVSFMKINDICEVYLKFNEPELIMGSKVDAMLISVCDLDCVSSHILEWENYIPECYEEDYSFNYDKCAYALVTLCCEDTS